MKLKKLGKMKKVMRKTISALKKRIAKAKAVISKKPPAPKARSAAKANRIIIIRRGKQKPRQKQEQKPPWWYDDSTKHMEKRVSQRLPRFHHFLSTRKHQVDNRRMRKTMRIYGSMFRRWYRPRSH